MGIAPRFSLSRYTGELQLGALLASTSDVWRRKYVTVGTGWPVLSAL